MNPSGLKTRAEILVLLPLILNFSSLGTEPPSGDLDQSFKFIQTSDLHLCGDGDAENFSLDYDPSATFTFLIEEIWGVGDFVVNTGDILLCGDLATIAKGVEWYRHYLSSLTYADKIVYPIIGNHDVIGVYNLLADPCDPLYGKGAFELFFGRTYRSVHYGGYDLIFLDPIQIVDRKIIYRLDEEQLNWLNEFRGKRLIFTHIPTPQIENWDEVTREGSYTIFSGHWHMPVELENEHVCGAVSGAWWRQESGYSHGYYVVTVGDEVSCEWVRIEPIPR